VVEGGRSSSDEGCGREPQEVAEIQAEYRRRSERSAYGAGCLFLLGLVLLPAFVAAAAPRLWTGHSTQVGTIAAVVLWLCFSCWNDRCPACSRWFPVRFRGVKQCPRCHTPLLD
jgi:hypothetical protein